MRKQRRNFYQEATRDPYELDLENPPHDGPSFVTFADPNKLETASAYSLARSNDPEEQLRLLLGGQFSAFWSEWRTVPLDETNALVADIFEHYGANQGKLPR